MSVAVGKAPVQTRVPMSGAHITDVDVDAVTRVLRSGILSIGPCIGQFEDSVARLAQAEHAIGISSGTAGLHMAVIAAGVNPGDIVITTPFSFVASANCVLYERGIPVFVDVDPVTGNIDPAQVTEAVRDISAGGSARRRWLPPSLRDSGADTGSLKAVLPVHAFGHPADMDPIVNAAKAHGVPVIEDACEALGASYKGRPVGTLGDVGVFAFYPNKQLTTGEGGIMVTNRGDWAAQFRSLRNQGRDTMDAWLHHDRLGYNYRMSELSAALGVSQMGKINQLLSARARVAGWYFQRLSDVPGVSLPALPADTTKISWFAFVVRLSAGIDRQRVMDALEAEGVPSRPYFSPIHLQPFYAQQFGYRGGEFPVTETLGECSLALPFSGTLTEEQVERVCSTLRGVLAGA